MVSVWPATYWLQLVKCCQCVGIIVHLDWGLWEVMWVPQLGGNVEPEVLGVLDGAVSQLDTDAASLFESLFEEEWLQDWVNLLPNVFQENRSSKLDAVLERSDKVAVCEFYDVEVVQFLHVFDPLVGLALRVNQERPATGITGGRSEKQQHSYNNLKM